jgi:hypothetical protein
VCTASIGQFPLDWVQCELSRRRTHFIESLARVYDWNDIGLEFGDVERRDQLTQVTDLLLRLVVLWWVGHSLISPSVP